jgi:RNA polymerase sigma-70 factor (ECF subfamily)
MRRVLAIVRDEAAPGTAAPANPPARPAPEVEADGDARLVSAALGGEERAFRMLYDRWRPRVFRVARSFPSLDPDEAQDVVQEAFVRAFGRLASLQDRDRFGPWLLTIARNRALSRLARRRAAQDLADDLAREGEADEQVATLPDVGREAELEAVRAVIAELPEGPEKETVHLFYVEGGLSTREIAARLGVGKSAITMRLERFRAKVKRRVLAEVARIRGEESWE